MARSTWGAVRKLPSKKYQASYLGPDRIRYTAPTTFTTKAMATSWLAAQRNLIESGEWVNPAKQEKLDPTFLEYATSHIQLQTKQGSPLRKNTQDLYLRLLRNQLSEFHGEKLKDISKNQVDRWFQGVLLSGKSTTAAKAYSLLSAVLTRALEDGLIKSNPCRLRRSFSSWISKRNQCPV